MRLPKFEYVRPSSLEEGLDLLQEAGKDATVLAGGTDLLVNMKCRVIHPRVILGVRLIPELNTITEDDEGRVVIGSCVILSGLATHPLITEKLPALGDAVRAVASKHIRNMATLGGNICLANRCWYYNQSKQWRAAIDPCFRTGGKVCHAVKGSDRCYAVNHSDTVPMLTALGAEVCVRNKDREKWIPMMDFYRDDGNNHTVLEPDEILTCIRIPKSASANPSLFLKITPRKGLDFAVGNIGVSVKADGKTPSEVLLVVNAVGSRPILLKKAARMIMESGFSEDAVSRASKEARSEIGTVTNLFTSAAYKRQMVETLTKRALLELKTKLEGRV